MCSLCKLLFFIYPIIWIISTIFVFSACPIISKKQPNVNNKEPAITTEKQASQEAILDVYLLKSDANNLIILIKNIQAYEQAQLECSLNKIKLPHCTNGAFIAIDPKVESYTLTVIAKNNSQKIIGVGEARLNIKDRSTNLSYFLDPQTQSYDHTLSLALDDIQIDNKTFYNGMGIRIDQDVKFSVHFINTPQCNHIELRCSSGLKDSYFKPLCDDNMSKYYPKGSMAKGIQFLTFQSFCKDTNSYGPPLILFWYGIPFNYKFMGLEYITNISRTEYIFNLIKANDCPINLLEFECKSARSSTFTKCSNYVKNPPPGFSIRPICNNKAYDILEL